MTINIQNILLMLPTIFLLGCSSGETLSGNAIVSNISDNFEYFSQGSSKNSDPETTTDKVIVARILSDGRTSNLKLTAQNRLFQRWDAPDGSALEFNNGVLIATFSLGHDLYSADVSELVQRIRLLQSGMANRTLHWLNGENQMSSEAFVCAVSVGNSETDLPDKKLYGVVLVTENCSGNVRGFENQYFVHQKTRTVKSSKQWVSPQIGYLQVIRRSVPLEHNAIKTEDPARAILVLAKDFEKIEE